jgi:vancomycin resistance protein YoaR
MKLKHKSKLLYSGTFICVVIISSLLVGFFDVPHNQEKLYAKKLAKVEQSLDFFISEDFTLSNKDGTVTHTIPKDSLSFFAQIVKDPKTQLPQLDIHDQLLEGELAIYNQEMQDAEFKITEDNTVEIIPSKHGVRVNVPQTELSILTSIKNKEHSAKIIFESIEPDLTTKEAEDLEIKHPVVSFTTYFACCEARAQNIERVAEFVDRALIYPGEEWNLNTYIGKRTQERGFLPAGTIVKGSMIETTGGGISQFATTFYNAVYWGGFQDISHTPHSRYFTRYPEGIEATISWPEPHLIFKNNSPYGILVHTKTAGTSVTVQFFSNNDGRNIQGKHKDGKTTITIVNPGGKDARLVESVVENKTEIYPPKEIYYVDEAREQNAIYTKTLGKPSYSVDIIRTIKNQSGDVLESKKWKTFYLSEDKEFLVQSCEFAPPMSICKTKEDVESEKKSLEEFFQKIEEAI